MVAAGANLSAFWIMAANSWMQTPDGFRLSQGKFTVTDFKDAIFTPAFPTHLAHMLVASYETAAFAVAGISAYFLLKGRETEFYKRSLGVAMAMALLFAPLQALVGDLKGMAVARHQPLTLAAMEAHWETNAEGGAPFVLFALPDMKAERNRYELTIPNGLSLLITRSLEGKVLGLKEFPPEDRPHVPVLFWSFRLMVAIGYGLVFLALWGSFLWVTRRSLSDNKAFLLALVAVQPLGFLATELGWITTELGRQPWVVYGLMRTAEGISPVSPGNVLWSLGLFAVIIPLIGWSYFRYVIKTLRLGPDLESPIPPVQIPAGMIPLKRDRELTRAG